MSKLLILFTRYPEPGKTKTRLIPVLGAAGAAALQREMSEDVLSRARPLGAEDVSLEVRYEGGTPNLMREWLGPGQPCREQGGGDVGLRMSLAFTEGFQAGFERIVLIGTDCPGISADLVRKAFADLLRHEVVLGPANDGGYYLVGLRRAVPRLFEGIAWGTSGVLRATLEIASSLRLAVSTLEPLDDVDRPEDLRVWEEFRKRNPERFPDPATLPVISIVIPTLDEEENIAGCLSSTGQAKDIERIVVDGGSRDRTLEIARQMGARTVPAFRGRAAQMNAGAREATGEVLIFLHADTRLPAGFDSLVRETLQIPGIAAGAFEFRLDSTSLGLRFIERVANWRSRRLQLPYGDQAIFLKSSLFREIGGFPEIPIMEDVELVRRLKKMGRIKTLGVDAVTSARRWRELGIWKTTLLNEAVLGAYYLGLSPLRIYRFSRRER
jgi:uncharacterized protein